MVKEGTSMKDESILGINYWPIDTAMAWWHRFDKKVVEEDLSRIQEVGFKGVRIFLIWEDFQPHPQKISTKVLDQLVTVLNIGHLRGLRFIPTFFTGHMSGINFLPLWMLESREEENRFPVFSDGKKRKNAIRNFYVDREVMKSQKLLLREVSRALQGHPALWAWDLGNEPSNLLFPPGPQEALRWLEEMVSELKRTDDSVPVTIGLHQEDLEEDRKMGPREVSLFCDFLCMHTYPIYVNWTNDPFDVDVIAFLGLLTEWLGSKEVCIEEVGIPSWKNAAEGQIVSEEQASEFYERLLLKLNPSPFLGLFFWCYGDYAKSLWAVPPLDEKKHERYFGLFREDRSPKTFMSLLNRLTLNRKEKPLTFDWIDIEPEQYYRSPRTHLIRLFQKFKEKEALSSPSMEPLG